MILRPKHHRPIMLIRCCHSRQATLHPVTPECRFSQACLANLSLHECGVMPACHCGLPHHP